MVGDTSPGRTTPDAQLVSDLWDDALLGLEDVYAKRTLDADTALEVLQARRKLIIESRVGSHTLAPSLR
jgi:hypothetical protein